jgi:hypothetical protein
VRPGDELRVESETLQVRPSKSRPDQGFIKVRTTTLNQNGEAVQSSSQSPALDLVRNLRNDFAHKVQASRLSVSPHTDRNREANKPAQWGA